MLILNNLSPYNALPGVNQPNTATFNVFIIAKQRNALPADTKSIECFNEFKIHLNNWTGRDRNGKYGVLCVIKSELILDFTKCVILIDACFYF